MYALSLISHAQDSLGRACIDDFITEGLSFWDMQSIQEMFFQEADIPTAPHSSPLEVGWRPLLAKRPLRGGEISLVWASLL